MWSVCLSAVKSGFIVYYSCLQLQHFNTAPIILQFVTDLLIASKEIQMVGAVIQIF